MTVTGRRSWSCRGCPWTARARGAACPRACARTRSARASSWPRSAPGWRARRCCCSWASDTGSPVQPLWLRALVKRSAVRRLRGSVWRSCVMRGVAGVPTRARKSSRLRLKASASVTLCAWPPCGTKSSVTSAGRRPGAASRSRARARRPSRRHHQRGHRDVGKARIDVEGAQRGDARAHVGFAGKVREGVIDFVGHALRMFGAPRGGVQEDRLRFHIRARAERAEQREPRIEAARRMRVGLRPCVDEHQAGHASGASSASCRPTSPPSAWPAKWHRAVSVASRISITSRAMSAMVVARAARRGCGPCRAGRRR
jgi:hypothetical protein